jgi:hypothetical protein
MVNADQPDDGEDRIVLFFIFFLNSFSNLI